tara:strand:+ start:699 stop:1409 length:711 start_codon:yes stop_codon:yes gene_type:complete
MNEENKSCFLCGSEGDITREHIPPKCLFPKPRPNNLLTVPCCFNCNNTASQDDEYLRLAASILFNRNEKGSESFKRVVESTLPGGRIKSRVDELRESMEPIRLPSSAGDIAATKAFVDADAINRSLVRVTKGIISISHPEVDLQSLDFEITQIDQFKLDSIVTSGVAEHFAHWSVGDGVYRNWRAFDEANTSHGIIVHMFYDAAIWMVKFEPGTGRTTLYGFDDCSQENPGAIESS